MPSNTSDFEIEQIKKASVHSVIKGDPMLMPMEGLMPQSDGMLKSVYEKRIN